MKKILLIEDEKILAEMYQDKFTQAGFKVFLALNSKEGLALAKKEKPDLVILDILLPKENGITFLTWLRKEPEISSTPVVAFSNYDDPETKRQAIKLGAKEYLIKTSYTPRQIVKKIKEYLK
jgi:two-component system alkaline phosphatase synthesis response regulator PhoP